MGFAGGSVDEGESLISAAIRECEEEINYSPSESQLELFSTHTLIDRNGEKNLHLFVCGVSVDEMYRIRKLSIDAKHAESEMGAFSVTHITDKSPEILMNQKWAGTGSSEIKELFYSGRIKKATVVE